MKKQETVGTCTLRRFVIFTYPQISLVISNQVEWGGRGIWHAQERREKCISFGGKPEGN
jgi:hypothetical protein